MSEEEKNDTFTFSLPEGEPLIYKSKSNLLKRLEREEEAWQFISQIEGNELEPRLLQLNRNIRFLDSFEKLASLKANIIASDHFQTLSNKIENEKNPYYTLPPWSDSPEGKAALRAKEAGFKELAIKILCGVIVKRNKNTNVLNHINNSIPGLIGELLATVNTACLYDSLVVKDSVRRRIDSLTTDATNEVERAGKLVEYKEIELNNLTETAGKINQDLSDKANRKENFFKQLIKAGIKQNKELNDKFLVQMRYRAPVKLWENRQDLHEKNAKSALINFYSGVLSLFVAIAFTIAYGSDAILNAFIPIGCDLAKPETCNGFSIRGFLLIATSTLITSVCLWVLRFQMKVHLSERHLALDAQERKAFAETFLALKEDKSVNENQEAIVLQSLFRPTQDGIIKDDNVVDATPAGLISRLLSQQGAK